MTRRNAVAAKLQSASQERSQTAVRHHGSTRHVAYACASIERLSMAAACAVNDPNPYHADSSS